MTAETLPLVLLPGYMLDETLWDDVAGKLGAPVQRMRLEPGKDLDEIAQGIGQRAPERFVLVGFSLGGYVARKVADAVLDEHRATADDNKPAARMAVDAAMKLEPENLYVDYLDRKQRE